MAKILVVDDEELYRKYPKHALEALGHDVQTSSTGREAIQLGLAYQPDVLVTDWRLEVGCTGLDVARSLLHAMNNVRVIIMTGYSTGDLLGESEIELFSVIEKPFSIEELVGSVTRAAGPPPISELN